MEKQALRKDRTSSKTTFVTSLFPFNLFRMRQREENRAKFATRWKEGEKKKAAEVIIMMLMMMMNDSGDIYIMMKCLSVYLSRKIITSHFRAERRKGKVSSLLGLAGRWPALA